MHFSAFLPTCAICFKTDSLESKIVSKLTQSHKNTPRPPLVVIDVRLPLRRDLTENFLDRGHLGKGSFL